VTLNDDENQITVSVYYGNPVALSGFVTGGHIHSAPEANRSNPIMFDLKPPTGLTNGSVVETAFKLTPEQVADLKAGLWCFNIHTSRFADGEIRGQISVDSPFVAYFDKNQEIPATDFTDARGSSFVSLNEATNQSLVMMDWSGLTGSALATRLYSGRAGTNGSTICELSSTAASSGLVVDKLCDLTPAQVKALKQAQLYLNIQTKTNPNGEIRGQLQRRAATVCDYDGDGVTDYAVYVQVEDPNEHPQFWIAPSNGENTIVIPWGEHQFNQAFFNYPVAGYNNR
jgi:hypothetical protein